MRAGSGAATAAALIVSPYLSATLTRAPGKSFKPLCTMASNTGWVSVGELLMTFRISGSRRLLLERFAQLTAKLRDICFPAGRGRTATAHGL